MFFDNYVVKEAYFGETKEIQKLYEKFDEFRDYFIAGMNKMKSRTVKNVSKLLKNKVVADLDKAYEDTFGFKSVSFCVDLGIGYNAYTFPLTYVTNKSIKAINNKFEPNAKTGYKYKDNKFEVIIAIGYDLLMDIDFDNRECFAIMLHEIGHLFQTTIYQPVNDFALFGINAVAEVESKIDKLLTQGKTDEEIEDIISKEVKSNFSVFEFVFSTLVESFKLINLLLTPIFSLIFMPIDAVFNLFFPNIVKNSYINEKVADSFAAQYGYGSDLIRALDKLETKAYLSFGGKIPQALPIIMQFVNLQQAMIGIFTHGLTTHPTQAARLNNIIYSLRTELTKSDLSPEMRKSIEKQLDQIEKDIIKYKKESFKFSNPLAVQKIYQMVLYKVFNNGETRGDIRELIYKKSDRDVYSKAEKVFNKK